MESGEGDSSISGARLEDGINDGNHHKHPQTPNGFISGELFEFLRYIS